MHQDPTGRMECSGNTHVCDPPPIMDLVRDTTHPHDDPLNPRPSFPTYAELPKDQSY